MAAGVTIKVKRKAGAFTGGELAAGELGLDVTNSKLYGSSNGSTVFVIDTVGLTDIVQDTSPQLGGNLDAQGNKITSLGTPTAGTDAVTKTYVDGLIQGLRWDDPVLAIQTDASLDPGASPTTGDRYILEASGTLHANFGTITGVGDDDIVEYNGSAWVIDFDASVTGEGETVYNRATNSSYTYNGSAWVVMGGTSDHGALSGLSDDDHAQYAVISSGSGAPGSTPARIGAIYVDTTAPALYVAKGSSSSADWQLQVNHTATLNNSGMMIDGGTL
jgi:hypothetical protein